MTTPEKKPILKTKTFWTAIAASIAALAGWQTETIPFADALQTLAISLIGIFIRKDLPK